MLIHNLEQGSEAWLRVRLGVPTTSMFASIITPTGKPSTQANGYLNDLIAEIITGELIPFVKTAAMMRGNELEPEAADYYEQYAKVELKEVGFVTTNDGRIGCSPDRLVGKDGLVEIKCPMPRQHVQNLRAESMDMKYYPQVQGQLLLTKRKWCDWVSYHPKMPGKIVRVVRDEEYLNLLKEHLDTFLSEQDKVIDMLRDRGVKLAINVKPRDKGVVEGL